MILRRTQWPDSARFCAAASLAAFFEDAMPVYSSRTSSPPEIEYSSIITDNRQRTKPTYGRGCELRHMVGSGLLDVEC
ncbi:hypothetical protein K439DRAFT_1634290 [Ramaria rubella]|nr:hypothetical protein K439DRAFT_1634290 [Ramaria rubella]